MNNNELNSHIHVVTSKINDNKLENNIYDTALKDTQDVAITQLNPRSFEAGTTTNVVCFLADGLPAEPSSLRVLSGTFTSLDTGQVYPTEGVLISDPEEYSQFDVLSSPLPLGDYTISILLGPTGKGKTKYRLTSTNFVSVTPEIPIRISTITPNTVTQTSLKETNFLINGLNLDKIQTSIGFYLTNPAYKFQFVGPLTAKSSRVRYASALTPEPGTYRVLARNRDGNIVYSISNMTITE
ncbi:hypothetical protein QGN29_11875 [Temperatibacter marinus]|uniref:Uncharacterized protein n=1 Tax=Temperatibacter marinus TaxID=1456591 RepID=A0AA52EH75_9PROT|nr:hypothetical protein [Temperatibacter marinus]WND02249.1 hypothetical protein QGN29_11875 [Temperatibacter marinus]